MELPPLDAHAHLDPHLPATGFTSSGGVLAMSLSLAEASLTVDRRDGLVAWGAGCHPRFPASQESFNINQFADLLSRTAIAGEVGLDTGSRVPIDLQLRNIRQVLEVVSGLPRLLSIHSYRATGLVLQELRLRPVHTPVLHWWTGSAAETSGAVDLGCYFSIHSAVARHSKFRTRVPLERILVESDHGYHDPPAAIPFRIGWVEHLVAQQFDLDVSQVRQLAWRNLSDIFRQTGTLNLLPPSITEILSTVV